MSESATTTVWSATPPVTSSAMSPVEVIARNLNALFDQEKRSGGRKVTNQDVAEHVTRITGRTCHRTWIAKLRRAKVTAPDIVRLDAVAEFFGHAQVDLVGVDHTAEPSHDPGGLSSLATRLEAHGVDLAQLASLEPEDVWLVGILVRRLTNKQDPQSDPT